MIQNRYLGHFKIWGYFLSRSFCEHSICLGNSEFFQEDTAGWCLQRSHRMNFTNQSTQIIKNH